VIRGVTADNIAGVTRKRSFIKLDVSLALVILCVIAAILSPAFLTPMNLMNLTRQVAISGIVGVGMTFVILTGGIDLSVGAIIGVVAVIVAKCLAGGMSVPLAMLLGLAIGALAGSINGIGVALGKIQPFIMTLASMVALRGVALTFSDGRPIGLGPASSKIYWLGGGSLGIVPVPVIVFTVVIAASYFMLKYTFVGRYIYAIGGNVEAARLSGISIERNQILVYTISGFLSALAALIWVSRLTVGEPTAGSGVELDAIAMVVIGGTSLMGGEGGVIGTLIGAMIIAVLANVLNLLGISPWSQQIFKGLIIILAVLIERFKKR
jgi:ribose/xylose/arabinose/galactoside ABC-type transport system permease subunit